MKVGLMGPAGVNKFVAKIASDYNKPNGQKTVNPDEVEDFLENLEIKKFYGIGKVTKEKMYQHGIFTKTDLKSKSKEYLDRSILEKVVCFILILFVKQFPLSEVKPNRI